MKHANIKIFGLVQGVFFRVTAKEQADNLGITGFARNEGDGTVLIEAEGKKESLGKLIKWCHKGPNLAQVKKVEVSESLAKNFSNFKVY